VAAQRHMVSGIDLHQNLTGDRKFDVRFTKVIFWVGFLVYAVSWFLPAVGPDAPFQPGDTHLFEWVADWFFWPAIYIHWHSVDTFLSDLTIHNASLVLNAWVALFFFVVAGLLVVGRTPRLNRILCYFVLTLIPFCWLAFMHPRTYYPRAGYFLWTAGMLLVLLSRNLGERMSESHKV
jgi:hypothetical protein